MKKRFVAAVKAVTLGMLVVANAGTQQPPPANSQQAPAPKAPSTPAAKAPAAKSQKGTGTKTRRAPLAKSQKPTTLTTQRDKVSYALGMNLGSNLHKQSVDVDPTLVLQGLKDALAAGKAILTEDEARATLVQLQSDMRKKQQEQARVLGEANKKQGEAFLSANKTKEGVVTLPSGLQYKVLQEGTGPKPTATDSVVCNYRGTLLDSTEFDSSYKRGQPGTFPVSGIIKGWTEALQLMPVGSKWQLFIPSALAYGERGAGGNIGPNATLVFEVELLSIQAKQQSPAKPAGPAEPETPAKPENPPKPTS